MTRVDPRPRFQLILIANYRPDAQQSMLRFAAVLERELRQRRCEVLVLAPPTVFGAVRPGRMGLGKWLGYADKFLVFPWILRSTIRRARRGPAPVVVHVCDHSNAIYTRYLRDVPHLVTCNDLLAVRSALGEFPQNPTRWSGRVLQRMILSGLKRAQQIACISDATRRDVLRLCSPRGTVHRTYMGLNYAYAPVKADETAPRVERLLGSDEEKFILHVGGNQWYKNRIGVLEIYNEIRKHSSGTTIPGLVMVGARFTEPMREFVRAHKLTGVVELCDVANEDLQALYSTAELLLYPSFAEGFGWPVLEAMASGCRVVTSNRTPLTELGGDAAAYIDPGNLAAAAKKTLAILQEPRDARHARIERGLRQQAQFSTAAMIDNYLTLYRSLLSTSREAYAPVAAL